MTDDEIQKALYRIVFDGGIDRNSSRDDIPTLLEKLSAEVIGWNTGVRETTVVELCVPCRGAGLKEHSELTDYHKGEYNYWDEPCKACGGSGRVKVTTRERRQPYQPLSATGPLQ